MNATAVTVLLPLMIAAAAFATAPSFVTGVVVRSGYVLVGKHRHGATTRIELFFDYRFTWFKDLAERN